MKWLGGFIVMFFLGFLLFSRMQMPSKVVHPPATQTPTITNTASNPSTLPTNDIPQQTIIAKNLTIPWSLVFLPDGNALFTERPGTVMKLSSSGVVSQVAKISNVNPVGEGGLLGIALDPQFSLNHFIYLYYTYGSSIRNRVVRMTYENDSLSLEKILVDGIPGAEFHDGGRIKFGPDGYLYIGTGDSENSNLSQDTNSLAGKILRVTTDGKPAPGNPFNNLVYSYGHRNVQGLAWDTQGNLWATEHGRSNPTGYDEVNKIEKGKNYGWPIIQGNETRTGMVTPVLNSGPTTTWAPSGAVVYKGSLFFAGLKGAALFEVKNLNSSPTLVQHLSSELGRIRDVVVGPDNYLYILTNNTDGRGSPKPDDDKIIRINPAKL